MSIEIAHVSWIECNRRGGQKTVLGTPLLTLGTYTSRSPRAQVSDHAVDSTLSTNHEAEAALDSRVHLRKPPSAEPASLMSPSLRCCSSSISRCSRVTLSSSTRSWSSAILLRAIADGSDERIDEGVRHERVLSPSWPPAAESMLRTPSSPSAAAAALEAPDALDRRDAREPPESIELPVGFGFGCGGRSTAQGGWENGSPRRGPSIQAEISFSTRSI